MNTTTEREQVAAILYGWTPPDDIDLIVDPNLDFEPPEPTGKASDPTCYLAWDIEYSNVEQITFGGTVHIEGDVVIWIWLERDVGDRTWRLVFDSLTAEFRSATPGAGLQFFEGIAGGAVSEGTFYGREVRIPFHRFMERP